MNLMMRYAPKDTLLLGLTSGLTKEVILTTNEAKHPFKLGQCSRDQRKMAGNISTTAEAKKCISVVQEGEADIKTRRGGGVGRKDTARDKQDEKWGPER